MPSEEHEAARARRRLVEELRDEGRLYTTRVAKALATVPRHEFVPAAVRDRAYEDRPLEIGHGQVVTAPHLVAQMSELLELKPGHRVLEIGTGSGYHAAVLAELVCREHVYTIERLPDLARAARAGLVRTGYRAVSVIIADGSVGLPGSPPFDRISVASVAPSIPTPLLDQLADDGRLVIPLGPRDDSHELVLVTKRDGRLERTSYGGVRFVPLIGEHGFAPDE